MKIFYAIQATGNGHLSRATQLYPYLKKMGEVDFFVSGNNASLNVPFPVKYKSKGVSLQYSTCGGLDYLSILKGIRVPSLVREALQLPLKNYDMVINDFECVTSMACLIQKQPSVQFGHQASFRSPNTPRPEKEDVLGEWIFKNYARSTQYLGLHFQEYDDYIFPPVIKDVFLKSEPSDHGHVTIYLPAYEKSCLLETLKAMKGIEFHWFLPEIVNSYREGNIIYFPVFQELFNESLLTCHGVITGGGFETPSEALYLGKKLLSIPIRKHYEQKCNAAALNQMGIQVLDDIDDSFADIVKVWYQSPRVPIEIRANQIQETLQYLSDHYPYRKHKQTEESALFI
jgi:uncharacterized protein (TIGR00661 family)